MTKPRMMASFGRATDQVELGWSRVYEGPVPFFCQQQLYGLGRGVQLEELWVLGLASPRPPGGETFLRVEVDQGNLFAILCGTHGKCAAHRRLADTALGTSQRHDAHAPLLVLRHGPYPVRQMVPS
jgi:hypothetical protein